ncbi:MAG: hypothetical protein U0354_14985 [Candidatus Sericytochromatia bacterium]
MKLRFLLLLFPFLISCVNKVITNTEPILRNSPTPELNPSFLPVSKFYLKLNTDKICYNGNIVIKGNIDSTMIGSSNGIISIYLENVTNSEGRVPPLKYENILLKKLDVQSNVEFNYSFKIESVIKSFDGNSKLELKTGKYSVYISSLNNTLYGVGSFELIDCQ